MLRDSPGSVHHTRLLVKLLVHLLLLISLSGLTGAAIVGHQSRDLGGVKGSAPVAAPVTDIADLLGQATIKRSAPIEIAEADLNQYLSATLGGKQSGRSAGMGAFEKVLVDLEPGIARITLCWLIKGYRTTSTLDLRLGQESGQHRSEVVSGAYGRMPVARGFLAPVLPAYQALAAACGPEIKSILNMTKIQIAKDKLVLDPRF